MPICYQLIGVPASGKSTWAKSRDWAHLCSYISTDKWIEYLAKETGQTYSQVFAEFMPIAVSLMTKEVQIAHKNGRDIIWDQTSVTAKSRVRKFRMLPEYEHIAVVFKTPEEEEHTRRLHQAGKEIPSHVIQEMIKNFEFPTEQEGFKEIRLIGF